MADKHYRRFTSLLVANRGEVARRILRSAHAMGLRTIVVMSDPDSAEPFAAEADEAVLLPGATARETYLDADAVLAAAEATGAEAIHPGYGFLAENAGFATAVQEAGLVWVGPPPAAMATMAGKVQAKAAMAAVGVPVLPGGVVIPGDDLEAAAASVGYPLLVKASAGGGGKGMRLVEEPEALGEAVAAAAREAASFFGDPTVFLERYLLAPHHVEVQILADVHGTVVHLGDRECSIQRRHQKVIEEAPAPAVDPTLRERMAAAAVAGTAALGYVGLGTFEFLVDGREFFFLEMNTRLQVEHPVTEAVTGLDLVRLQLLAAMGALLPLQQSDVVVRGHAIEARLYAEDPASGWLPSTGVLHRFAPAAGSGIRWDTGVQTGSVVTPYYDPMLAKAIAVAPTRDEAAGRLARALDRTEVHGVTTNAALLTAVLRHPRFLAGDTTTAFLDQHPAVFGEPPAADEIRRRHAVAAALAGMAERRSSAKVAAFAPPGWRNVFVQPQRALLRAGGANLDVDYRLDGDGSVRAVVDGAPIHARLVDATADAVHLQFDRIRRRYGVHRVGDTVYIDGPDGHTSFTERSRFPRGGGTDTAGSTAAPVPGTIVAVHVAPGDPVETGQLLAVLEAMKVEHQIRAATAGRVEAVLVAVGDSVEAHAPLLSIDASTGERSDA
ncbi:MAG TPA: biotin carboxylase N-terminal domain-containing protein [Acidimicrobiia bacterium]|nr:biotin carboxylase N-terminal domain-containing protein [Acidimicrobiia bacterium]